MTPTTTNLPMRHATAVAIWIMTLFMISAMILFSLQEQASNTAKGWVVHTYEVTGHIQLLFNRLKDVELGQRGYMIAGDEKYLAPYYDALKDSLGKDATSDRLEQHHSIAEELKILKELTKDSAQQQDNVNELDSDIKELLGYWAATIQGRQSHAASAPKLDFHQEDQLMNNIRSLVSIMMANENHLLTQRIKSDKASTQLSINLTLSGIAFFYIIMVLAVLLYQRSRLAAIKALQESNSLKAAVLSSTEYLVVATDKDGLITVFNEAAHKALGYTAEEVVGKQTPAIWHDPEEVIQHAEELSQKFGVTITPGVEVFSYKVKNGLTESGEWTFIHKDGHRFPGQLVITALKNSDNVITGFLGVIEDISEYKKAEAEREKLISLIEESTDYIGVADLKGKLQYHNRSAMRMIGLPEDYDLSQLKMSDMHPAWATKIILTEAVPATFKSGSWQGETALLHKDGHEIPVLQNLALHRNAKGEPVCFTTIMRDITERKESELLLKTSEETFRLAMDYAPIGMAIVSPAGKWLKVNSALCHILGYTAEEFQAMDILVLTHPDDVEKSSEKVKQLLAKEINTYNLEKRYFHKNGQLVWVQLHVSLVCNEDETPKHFVAQIQDITNVKISEKQREDLMKKLADSNTELERFAYVASHDMQEPLRMIGNFSELVAVEYGDKLDAEGKQYIDIVTESSKRMQSMIEDLLEYARVGNDAMRLETIYTNKELQHVLENLSGAIHEHQARITHDLLPEVKGNAIQFMRLLQNLIGNGLKYQPKGVPPVIHIGVEDQNQYWRFSIRDNGIGMEADYVERIFEPFKRLHTWQEYKGTGIGLAVCKKIVENHGGKIWAMSAPGKGSTFYFTLPKTS